VGHLLQHRRLALYRHKTICDMIKYMKKIILLIILLLAFGASYYYFTKSNSPANIIVTNFAQCAEAGNPVMESYPRQCAHNGQTFTEEVPENIGNINEKKDLIQITSPLPNQKISSPLVIKGKARGGWFFEASFPVFVTNWDGLIIGEGYAQADGDWMTSEFVPYTATITFSTASITPYNRGTLILKKDNPSGMPENDDALEIPINF